MNWPAMSPDLNDIENVWSGIGCSLMPEERIASDPDGLWDEVLRIWISITLDEIREFVESISMRIEAIIADRGGSTKY